MSTFSKLRMGLISSLLVLFSTAAAQWGWGMPDFSNFDLNGYMQQQYDMTTALINDQMAAILQQRGPEIQAAYQNCLNSGRYCGRSFEEYALEYVSTSGFTDGGTWARTQQGMQQKEQQAWLGLQAAEQNSSAAINGWNNNYYQNHWELGNHLGGSSTWTNPATNMNHTLPYMGIQPGQNWYDSASGYHFMYNPYQEASGPYYTSPNGQYYQPMNPWQAPRW